MEIEINHMGFSYSSIPVLNDITLKIEGPKFVSILGPNGVGKSTLMHCINKLLVPTEGTVFIDGENVKEITIKEMAKQVGYVPYSTSDVFPLTVVDITYLSKVLLFPESPAVKHCTR